MATPHAHRLVAEELLGLALEHAITSPARLALLTEAQVHATLALAPVEIKAAPRPRKAPTAKEAEK